MKLRVGVIYGGRSGEHEVSLASAAAVFKNLDPGRYDAVPIRIEKDGAGRCRDAADARSRGRRDSRGRERPDLRPRAKRTVGAPGGDTLMTIDRGRERGRPGSRSTSCSRCCTAVRRRRHGAGLLELANVPYVGAGVLASAVGMDKAVMKLVFAREGLPICDYEVVMKRDWQRDERGICSASSTAGLPVFVKPANLGSSVGISKAKHVAELRTAISSPRSSIARSSSRRRCRRRARSKCAVLGNDEPEASVPGEIIPSREFYDYEAKYLDERSRDVIPRRLAGAADESPRARDRRLQGVDCAGMARVDFSSRRQRHALPQRSEHHSRLHDDQHVREDVGGERLSYPALLDRLIALAIERHADKQQLRTSM
jgi:D-alanine-D-alanine ligase